MKHTLPHEKPVAVYRTTISIILFEILYLAAAIGCGYIVFQIDVLWAQLLLGFLAVMILWACRDLLKYRNDRIVVTPSHLSFPNVETRTKKGKHTFARKVIIPWHDIKDITFTINVEKPNSVRIRKLVFVILNDKMQYTIDAELYDVFFLERKLKSFWQQYGKKTLT
jgi:hypothetical protein